MDDGFGPGLLIGALVATALVGGFISPVACSDNRRYHVKAAVGCTSITKEEAGVQVEDPAAVYWRCKDGKVYVR